MALVEVPGSPRQFRLFRVVPSKRCSLFLMGVENLLLRQVEQFLSLFSAQGNGKSKVETGLV